MYLWQGAVDLEQDGQLGPLTGPTLTRTMIGELGQGRCEADGPPRYRPSGPIKAKKIEAFGETYLVANFNLFADFRSDPANGVLPSCCEVRQEIKWDQDFVDSLRPRHGGVPHAGFKPPPAPDTWVEDRNADDTHRYGYRSGPYRELEEGEEPSEGDKFVDSKGVRNTAFGHRYIGLDSPHMLGYIKGSFRFRLHTVDICNGDTRVATSDELELVWAEKPTSQAQP